MTSYSSTFEKSESGRIEKLLPLHAMAEIFGLVSKSTTSLGKLGPGWNWRLPETKTCILKSAFTVELCLYNR